MLVLVEKTRGGFRAASGKPLEAEAEAATRDEALAQLRATLTERLRGEVELVDLDIPGTEGRRGNPWLRVAGVFKDDPLFDEWQENIAANRRRDDAPEDAPA